MAEKLAFPLHSNTTDTRHGPRLRGGGSGPTLVSGCLPAPSSPHSCDCGWSWPAVTGEPGQTRAARREPTRLHFTSRDSDVHDCRLHRAQLEHDPGSGDLLLCSPPPQPRCSPDPQLPGHPRGCPLPSSNTSMWAARPHEPTVFRETTCWRGLQCLNQNAPCALIPQTCSEIGALNKAEPVTVR